MSWADVLLAVGVVSSVLFVVQLVRYHRADRRLREAERAAAAQAGSNAAAIARGRRVPSLKARARVREARRR